MAEDVEAKARNAVVGFGVAATGGGLGVITPGVQDAILTFADHKLGLKLFETPPVMGWTLIGIGCLFLLLGFFGQNLIERAVTFVFNGRGSTIGTFLTVKHIGFVPPIRDVQSDELPKALRRRDFRHLTVDLGPQLAASPQQVEAAVAQQQAMPASITAMLGMIPNAEFGYCGIVQAPFQLLAGYQLMSWTRVRTFEWDRHASRYAPIEPGAGANLGVTTTDHVVGAGGGADVGIAIEISYSIAEAEMTTSLPDIGRLVRIGVAAPRIDIVTHEGQIEEIARQFRAALDGTRGIAHGGRVHVFCTAPMSVGFALGRMISRTLHPPVVVHVYDRSAAKPYPWGLQINAAPGAPMVVRN